MIIKDILFVGAGSFAGGILRYVVSRLMNGVFPWGTMLVNISGCLLIGILFGLFERGSVASPELRLLLIAGFCGGYTTFSAFAHENMTMLRAGEFFPFAFYVVGSVLLGLAAVWFGHWLIRTF